MGIQGLLPLLKSIHKPTELKKYSGEVFGVDAYGWLHRGAVGCAVELAQGKPTRKYVDFAMHRVRMAKHFGVTPYLVFDGDFLPSKARTESSRAKRRDDSRKAGLAYLKAGKPSQAHLELQKAIDITPEMARQLIEELKIEDVPYIVAPYEADAQLVYLERHGHINGIISEDSDLLVFGAKRLLTKMDQYGQCVEINRRDFCAVREIALTGWTDDQFRQMAIFSGCDYLENIGNMGLKTAYRMMRKYKTPERVIRMLQFDSKFRVSENYETQYRQAESTFLYQRVFCPIKQKLVLLTEPHASSATDIDEMPYIGARVDAELAKAISRGDVNPITKQPIVVAALPSKKRTVTGTNAATAIGASTLARSAHHKPLDSYFDSHRRIPMGEMDRNCFSVDPESVAALTRNGATPRVFPLPRPYLDGDVASARPRPYLGSSFQRRRTEPSQQMYHNSDSSLVHSTSRRKTMGPDRRLSEGETRPLKKPRLCDDDADSKATSKPTEKSKFFSLNAAPVKTCGDIILMSDDSIEEAVSILPDIHEKWKKPRVSNSHITLHIFQDGTSTQDSDTATAQIETEQCDLASGNSEDDRPLIHSGDRASKDEPGIDEGVVKRNSLRRSLKDYTYAPNTPGSPKTTRMAHGLPTPASSVQLPQPQQEPKSKLLPPTPAQSPLQTPLQRMGAVALQRSRISYATQVKSRNAIEKQTNLCRTLETFPVNPAFVALPKVNSEEVEALNKAEGSEDQIFSCSDEENEPPATRSRSTPRASKDLDLSRFIYN